MNLYFCTLRFARLSTRKKFSISEKSEFPTVSNSSTSQDFYRVLVNAKLLRRNPGDSRPINNKCIHYIWRATKCPTKTQSGARPIELPASRHQLFPRFYSNYCRCSSFLIIAASALRRRKKKHYESTHPISFFFFSSRFREGGRRSLRGSSPSWDVTAR